MAKDTLFMDAANLVPLGPWHVPFTRLWHGSVPSPTAKKNLRSTVRGTRAGYRALARLRKLAEKLATAPVSLYAGSAGAGMVRSAAARSEEYSRTAVAVVLSNVPTVLV
uniref:LAC11 n=1 Tax=Arundo donax TaxID=35708 RepID=A0A0A9DV54_ARUDO